LRRISRRWKEVFEHSKHSCFFTFY